MARRNRTFLGKNNKRDIDGIWQHDLFDVTESQIAAENSERQRENLRPAQLYISNLHFNVSEQDLFDLFSAVGQLKDVSKHFDHSGRSTGGANVFFERKIDALEAISRYNGCFLDQRKIEIELWHCTATESIRQRRDTQKFRVRNRAAKRSQGEGDSKNRSEYFDNRKLK